MDVCQKIHFVAQRDRQAHAMKKFIAFVLSLIYFVKSQKLTSRCENGNYLIEIPSPNEISSQLLYLKAGTCDQTDYNGILVFDSDNSTAKISIPMDACNMRVPIDNPVTVG